MVNIRNYICTVTCAVLLLFLTGCNTDAWQSILDRNTAAFTDQAGGKMDPDHLYMTGVQVKLTIHIPDAGSLRAIAIHNQEAYLFHEIYVTSDTTFTMVAPQGFDSRIHLVFNDITRVINREIYLTGNLQEEYEVTFSPSAEAPRRMLMDDEDEKNNLYNLSDQANLTGKPTYSFFSGDVWKMVSEKLPEGLDAMYSGYVTNYEFYNPQAVSLALVMGNNSGTVKRVLGYYYHSPGTYEDITFCDVAEVNYHNYVDGLRTVKFKRKGSDIWEDMDFSSTFRAEMKNGFATIDSVRGLTFSSKPLPRGMMVGVYFRFNYTNMQQRKHLVEDLGIPSDRLPSKFMEMNFTNKQLNVDGLHRSVVLQHNEATYLGLEDLSTDGDYDCNDLIMRLTPDSIYESLIELDNSTDTLTAAKPLRWTLAFENIYRDADFDYNDVVIRIDPNYKTETATVWVSAYGSDDDMTLYYQGKDGVTELCRMRSLFTGQTFVNTRQGQAYVSPIQIATIAWPSSRTAYENAEQLYVTISHGDCPDGCEDLLALQANKGNAPSAILVAEYWQWPMEGVSIFNAYRYFAEWSRRQTETRYWMWFWK